MSDYLLVKRGLYYRPYSAGYTGIKEEAGRYSKADAEARAEVGSEVTMLPEDEAPDYSPSCCADVRVQHQLKKAEEKIAALEEVLRRVDMPCTCHDDYLRRRMQDPDCRAGEYGDDVRAALGLAPRCRHTLSMTPQEAPDDD